jgi:pimeloyl-ACP methyl ester carboxylesterase
MLKDVIRVLDGKEIRSAHWVGLSAGGQLALRASLDRPDRTRSLAMFGGSAYTDPHTRAIADRWAQTLATDGADAYALRRLKDLYYPDWIEAHLDVADRAREDARHRELSWAGQWSRAVAAFDERDRIRWLTCPILLVHGLDDTVVDPAHGRIFRQSVPGAQLRLLPQTGHMVPVERPQETLEILEGFLDGVETPGGDRSRR